jgi:hypothetical protein
LVVLKEVRVSCVLFEAQEGADFSLVFFKAVSVFLPREKEALDHSSKAGHDRLNYSDRSSAFPPVGGTRLQGGRITRSEDIDLEPFE